MEPTEPKLISTDSRRSQGRPDCSRSTNRRRMLWLAMAALVASAFTGYAANVYVPNYSFESPVVPQSFPYATDEVDEWQETPQPADYDPTQNYNTPWSYLVGTFYNVPFPGSYIGNLDGVQAAFLQAYPDVGLFQDYNSLGGTNSVPDHAFNATFKVGKAYTLTVGLTSSSNEPLTPGSTLQLSLYYRDGASNIVTVAATNVIYDTNVFTNLLQLTDFQARVPGVKATDPWAGQNIGIQLLCTPPSLELAGGFWDADNLRLTETVALNLASTAMTNGHFQFTVQSEPGVVCRILATTNLDLPGTNWTSLATVTNTTGSLPFADPATGLRRRFYTVQPVP
jgi:hypothetical protein